MAKRAPLRTTEFEIRRCSGETSAPVHSWTQLRAQRAPPPQTPLKSIRPSKIVDPLSIARVGNSYRRAWDDRRGRP